MSKDYCKQVCPNVSKRMRATCYNSYSKCPLRMTLEVDDLRSKLIALRGILHAERLVHAFTQGRLADALRREAVLVDELCERWIDRATQHNWMFDGKNIHIESAINRIGWRHDASGKLERG